jgi:hypothetical protein
MFKIDDKVYSEKFGLVGVVTNAKVLYGEDDYICVKVKSEYVTSDTIEFSSYCTIDFDKVLQTVSGKYILCNEDDLHMIESSIIKFNVGDMIESSIHGKGEVYKLDLSSSYPVRVHFNNEHNIEGNYWRYMYDRNGECGTDAISKIG